MKVRFQNKMEKQERRMKEQGTRNGEEKVNRNKEWNGIREGGRNKGMIEMRKEGGYIRNENERNWITNKWIMEKKRRKEDEKIMKKEWGKKGWWKKQEMDNGEEKADEQGIENEGKVRIWAKREGFKDKGRKKDAGSWESIERRSWGGMSRPHHGGVWKMFVPAVAPPPSGLSSLLFRLFSAFLFSSFPVFNFVRVVFIVCPF